MVDMFLADDNSDDLDWMPQRCRPRLRRGEKQRSMSTHHRDELLNVDQMRQSDERITRKVRCHEQIIEISAVLMHEQCGGKGNSQNLVSKGLCTIHLFILRDHRSHKL